MGSEQLGLQTWPVPHVTPSEVTHVARDSAPCLNCFLEFLFSYLDLHTFLKSASWAPRVSATLSAGAPGPPADRTLDISPVLASDFSLPPNFVLVFQPDVWVGVGMVMVMVMKTMVTMTLVMT